MTEICSTAGTPSSRSGARSPSASSVGREVSLAFSEPLSVTFLGGKSVTSSPVLQNGRHLNGLTRETFVSQVNGRLAPLPMSFTDQCTVPAVM